MHSSKQNLSVNEQSNVDNQDNAQININTVRSDVDSPVRSYAIIESNPNELDHIVDLLRQFFPKTKVFEYNNQNCPANAATSQQQQQQQQQTSTELTCSSDVAGLSRLSFDNDVSYDQSALNTNSQIFKGKLKGYLQRRYIEQLRENDSHKEMLSKSRRGNINSLDLSSVSTVNQSSSSPSLKSHSFDSSFQQSVSDNCIQADYYSPIHSSNNKRGSLQRSININIDDGSKESVKTKYRLNQQDNDEDDDDDDDDEDEDEDDKFSLRYSYSECQADDKNNQFLLPYHHSSDLEKDKRTSLSPFPSGVSLPLTPYSASSDPGPFHSPWFNTPTSPYKFRFPQCQDQAFANAQGSINQLSTLTKMLCDEPSLHTPVSPRFKTEKHDSMTSKDSSSAPTCQICRQEFDSRQTYLAHYRTHLENSYQDEKSDILDFNLNNNRSSNLRNYSCKICSKHFSRSDMLNRHLRLHSGTRPYRCRICNINFSRSDHLSTHFRTHTGEKPYTCPQCSYTACRRDMITRHIKVHTKQRTERKHATSTFAFSNEP